MHGSARYLSSANCLRELATARRLGLPLVRVHESESSKHGTPLASLRLASSRKLTARDTEYLFDEGEVIPWHRVSDFRMMSLASIAEQMLLASPA